MHASQGRLSIKDSHPVADAARPRHSAAKPKARIERVSLANPMAAEPAVDATTKDNMPRTARAPAAEVKPAMATAMAVVTTVPPAPPAPVAQPRLAMTPPPAEAKSQPMAQPAPAPQPAPTTAAPMPLPRVIGVAAQTAPADADQKALRKGLRPKLAAAPALATESAPTVVSAAPAPAMPPPAPVQQPAKVETAPVQQTTKVEIAPAAAPKADVRPIAEARRESPSPVVTVVTKPADIAPAPAPQAMALQVMAPAPATVVPAPTAASNQQIAALPLPTAPGTAMPNDQQIKGVLTRSEGWMKAGNIANARALLSDAARGDNPDLLTALAETYDPVALRSYPKLLGQADPAKAVEYYSKAAAKGSDAARDRLTSLNQFIHKR